MTDVREGKGGGKREAINIEQMEHVLNTWHGKIKYTYLKGWHAF